MEFDNLEDIRKPPGCEQQKVNRTRSISCEYLLNLTSIEWEIKYHVFGIPTFTGTAKHSRRSHLSCWVWLSASKDKED